MYSDTKLDCNINSTFKGCSFEVKNVCVCLSVSDVMCHLKKKNIISLSMYCKSLAVHTQSLVEGGGVLWCVQCDFV